MSYYSLFIISHIILKMQELITFFAAVLRKTVNWGEQNEIRLKIMKEID